MNTSGSKQTENNKVINLTINRRESIILYTTWWRRNKWQYKQYTQQKS